VSVLNKPKVIVLGLDGADWKIIDHMIEMGKMPTLASIKQNGAWGPLNSTIPPITCPAWLVFGTGKNPGKLGVYYFLVREGHGYHTVPFYFEHDVSGDNFWDLLSMNGFNVGIVNVPTVHKPHRINGFIVAGFMSKSRKRWLGEGEGDALTYPEDLGREISDNVGEYNIDFPKTTSPKAHLLTLEEEIEDYEEVALQRAKALEYLMKEKEWDLMVVDIMATDRIGHSMAQIISPSGGKYVTKQAQDLRTRIEEFYSNIDSIVGRIKKSAGEDAYIFIISDHGMGPQKGKFAVNDWLMKNGFLHLRSQGKQEAVNDKPSLKNRLYHRLSRISKALHLSRIIERIVKLLPNKLQGSVPYPLRGIKDDEVDWSRTKVFYKEYGHLFINQKGREPEGIVDPERSDALVNELIEKLKKETSAHFGNHGRLRYFKGKDIYSGRFREFAPDLYFDIGAVYYNIDARIGHEGLFERTEDSIRGNHRQNGIFMIQHRDVRKGRFDGLNLMDIGPTVLHIFDQSLPEGVDGRVLKELYKEDSDLARRTVRAGGSIEKLRLTKTISKLKL
jgi:predicted AlkP superfamily phosphohydrolase/phosphomutase